MKIIKRILVGFGIVLILIICTAIYALLKIEHRTVQTQDDYSSIYTNPKYQNAILIKGLAPIRQNISCGYAVIEMFAKWDKNESLTEKSLPQPENRLRKK